MSKRSLGRSVNLPLLGILTYLLNFSFKLQDLSLFFVLVVLVLGLYLFLVIQLYPQDKCINILGGKGISWVYDRRLFCSLPRPQVIGKKRILRGFVLFRSSAVC